MNGTRKLKRVTLAYVLALACAVPATAGAEHVQHLAATSDAQGRTVYVNAPEVPPPALQIPPGLRSAEILDAVRQASRRQQLDPSLLRAVIRVESGYNPRAVSSKGALGLMQLVPATAERFGVQDAFDPRQNIEGGATYLRYLLNLFSGDLSRSLAAYNAGEHAVLRSAGEDGGIPPFPETRDYVRKVRDVYGRESGAGAPPVALSGTTDAARIPKAASKIYSFVDGQGVVHFEQ